MLRNHTPLNRSCHLYLLTTPKPELPTKRGDKPYLVDYADRRYMAARAVRQATIRPQHLIAVMTVSDDSREAMRLELEHLCEVNNIRFVCYRSNERHASVDFNEGGILLLNIQGVKGLEFNSVLIADLHEHFIYRDGQAQKMRLYVATSRPTDRLFILYDRTHQQCPLLPLMPGDEVLGRYRLPDKGTAP